MMDVHWISRSVAIMTLLPCFMACGPNGQPQTQPEAEKPAETDSAADPADLVRQLNESLELSGRGTVPDRSFSTNTAAEAWLLRLHRLPKLKSLYLFNTTAHHSDLQPPGSRADAVTVHLCLQTQITDDTLARLERLSQLQALIVDSPHVTDAGLVYLAKLQNLKTLQLRNCRRITGNGVAQLQQALPDTKVWER